MFLPSFECTLIWHQIPNLTPLQTSFPSQLLAKHFHIASLGYGFRGFFELDIALQWGKVKKDFTEKATLGMLSSFYLLLWDQHLNVPSTAQYNGAYNLWKPNSWSTFSDILIWHLKTRGWIGCDLNKVGVPNLSVKTKL